MNLHEWKEGNNYGLFAQIFVIRNIVYRKGRSDVDDASIYL